MEELISVIVPVFNVEQFVEQCVDSIIHQTYKNIEIILVDDGSTDKSGFICDQCAEKDSRIHIIHKKNGGLSDARNVGLSKATGTYYSFIDSDDYIAPNTFEYLYLAVKEHECEIAVCNMIRVYEDGDTEGFYKPTEELKLLEGKTRFDTLVQPSVCNKLFRAELFEGVLFPVGKFYEDTFVYHVLAHRAKKIALTGYDGYWYRSRKTSILGEVQYNDRYFDFIEAVWVRAKYLLDKDIQPYGDEACLSLYVAVANAQKNISKTEKNKAYFVEAKKRYNFAYNRLMSRDAKVGIKQKLRLILLQYFPILHCKVY
mgnify:CR=1 FL=1